MNKIKYLLLMLLSSTLFASTNIIEKNGLKYFSDVVVLKFKTEQSISNKRILNKTLSKQFASFGVLEIEKYFSPNNESEYTTLSNIYRLKISSPYNPVYVSSKLARHSDIEWAEPLYLREVVHTPNDPSFNNQYALAKVQAEAAWNISKGNSSIVVAIVDSGVDWNHDDLTANIWNNSDEVLDGTDTDGNGYIDDIRGWDFGGLDGTPDNDPTEDSPTHGTHVAGIASAVTNNSIGVAGLGYNIKIMPVKTSQHDVSDEVISYGYKGIIYAADNGADIINCSWGGFGYSQAEQEVINYAVSKGSVIVCAAGNDGLKDVIFPAAYDGVLSVGNTNSSDHKSASSNYGINLDVCAPGSGIYNTWQGSSSPYATLSGTSMASPLVAGLAGLVIDKFPSYTPLQVIEQIRINADNIDAVNPGKENMLGSGRINAFKALSNTNSKSVRILNYNFVETSNPNEILERGEEVKIEINFTNYLNPISSFTAVLSTESSGITITNANFSTASQGTLDQFNNAQNPFKFLINENSDDDEELIFKLTYSDGSYSDFELISVNINPTYVTQVGKNISLTIASSGNFAFNDYPNNMHGKGFTYMQGGNLLFEAGLMYGVSSTKIVNSIRSSNSDIQDNDFNIIEKVQISTHGTIADQEALSVFGEKTTTLGIETTLKTYSFSDAGNDSYVILKYLFKNNSGVNISNFYSGIFFDWDIDEAGYEKNNTKYDLQNNFGYVYHSDNEYPLIGMALLSNGTAGFYGITNDGSDGKFGIYDGFLDKSKWLALTSGLNKTDTGPKDVSCVISSGPFTIDANSTLVVAFAINAAMNLTDLRASVENSREKYNAVITDITSEKLKLPKEFLLSQNYPNPFNPTTTIEYSIPKFVKTQNLASQQKVTLKIYDILGKEVATLVNQNQRAGNYEVTFNGKDLTSGIYFYKLTSGAFASTKKLILLK